MRQHETRELTSTTMYCKPYFVGTSHEFKLIFNIIGNRGYLVVSCFRTMMVLN
jgi:hypothetical protein